MTDNPDYKSVTLYRYYLVTVKQEVFVRPDTPEEEYPEWASEQFGLESDTQGTDVVDQQARGKWATDTHNDTNYRLGLPTEKLRRSVPLWQARLTRQGERPFMLWFTVDKYRLPKEAAHTCASGYFGLDPRVWALIECRPTDENGTPIPWEE